MEKNANIEDTVNTITSSKIPNTPNLYNNKNEQELALKIISRFSRKFNLMNESYKSVKKELDNIVSILT